MACRPHRALELSAADLRPQRGRGAGRRQRLRGQAGRGCLPVLLKLAEIAAEAGLPAGALNIVTGYGHEAGAALSAHPGIDHIFTGSPQTGKMVAHAAADNHVPVTLELGGKSPQIVFDDADLDAAMPVLLAAIIQNAGQTCSAGSRVLIQRGVYETVLKRLSEAFAATVTGPAAQDLDGPADQRPPARPRARLRRRSRGRGPEGGGARQAQDGASASGYYQVPVLFRDVPPNSRLAQEEVFGPVLAAMAFDTEEEAVALANGTLTAWSPASGRATAPASCAWPASCAPVRSSSITTARAVGWNCRSAVRASRVMAARRVRGAVWLHDLEDDCDQALTRWRGFVARPRPRRVRGLGFCFGRHVRRLFIGLYASCLFGRGCAICCDGMRAWLRADPGGFGGGENVPQYCGRLPGRGVDPDVEGLHAPNPFCGI